MLATTKSKLTMLTMLTMLLVLSCSAFATEGWHFTKGAKKDPNKVFHLKWPGEFRDDITQDQAVDSIKLTAKQQHQAKVWDLSKKQEQRYVALMQNKSGSYYKKRPLSPVEVLGINARTDQEREYYAMLAAQQESQRIAKELAYDNTFRQSYIKLVNQKNLPVVRDFNTRQYSPYFYKPVDLKPNDQLVFFVKQKDVVDPVTISLLNSLKKIKNLQLNIYFVDKNVSKQQIFTWADHHYIPQKMVKDKLITLNFGYDKFQNLVIKDKRTPLLLRIRGDKTTRVDMGRF